MTHEVFYKPIDVQQRVFIKLNKYVLRLKKNIRKVLHISNQFSFNTIYV